MIHFTSKSYLFLYGVLSQLFLHLFSNDNKKKSSSKSDYVQINLQV